MKVALDFNNVKPPDLVVKFRYIGEQMTTNVATFPKPPVAIVVFLAKVDELNRAIVLAMDSKKAISLRDKLQHEVTKMATLLGHYVESIADDAATIYLSGFEPAYKYRRLPQPLPRTGVSKVLRGPNSGTALAYITPLSRSKHGKVNSYELRYAAKIGDEIGEFTVFQKHVARFPIPVKDLTPGRVYIFQARALNSAGFNDWSDSVSYMAT
jgi:hypothetical protein